MRDISGREISYLRLSVTDCCNLHCLYCKPQCSEQTRPPAPVCSIDQLYHFALTAVRLGVHKIRLTGGEPLLRADLIPLIKKLRTIPGLDQLCLTSNGTQLSTLARDLKSAGLDRLNISLDTLRADRYSKITRTGELSAVLSGIEKAEQAGFQNLKINCVLIKDFNEDEIADFIHLTRQKPWQIRFIELMPVGESAAWAKTHFLSAQSVLSSCPELVPAGQEGVASVYRLPGAKGSIGLITPLSHAFCADCNKIRITSDGKLKPCLHNETEIPLQGLFGTALYNAMRQGILQKPAQHHLEQKTILRNMVSIGG